MGQEPRIARSALRTLKWVVTLSIAMGLASAADAQVRLVSAKRVGDDPPADPVYVDRVIEGMEPQAAEVESAEQQYNRAGWPRFLRLETRLGTQPVGERKREVGFTAAGAIDTPNHGTLSVDASVTSDGARNAVTLRQRRLPVEGGWEVNNELGVTTSLAPALMRMPSRVFVPGQYTRGVTTEWLNPALGAQLMAGTGDPGWLQGYPVSGFRSLAGTITTVGAQRQFGSWGAAVRHVRTDGISNTENPSKPSDYIDSDSTHVAVRAESGALSVQANAVSTHSSETSDTRRGVWVDGEWRHGSSLYGWGFFRLDPHLSWSGQGMSSDTKGAFARGSWQTRQWSAEASVDALGSISRPDDTGVLVTANGRWRYSRSLNLGAGGSVRDFNGKAGSAFADARFQNDWGTSAFRVDGTSSAGLRSRRLTLDHAWMLPQGWALNSGVSVGRESGEGSAGSVWGAAVSFAAPVGNELTLLGNASTDRQGSGSRSTSANLSLVWKLNSNWSVEGNFLYSQGRQNPLLSVDPLAPPPDRSFLSTDTRSFYLVLRYEDSAGSRSLPLGGTSRTGGGGVEGVVYLDANRNGAQDAGEQGAPGVTVYMDGRYAVRTDSQGRFKFPFVAPGTRSITVLNETLPLPWEVGNQRETRVEVIVRETTGVAIPVVQRGGN